MPITQTDRDRRKRLERALALGRLSLGVLLALVLGMERAGTQPPIPLTFLAGYVGYAWVAAVIVALAGAQVGRLGTVLHWIDVAWVLPITALTEGPNNVFLAFYLFALVGAAFRWGLRQTAATGFITAVALFAEAAAREAGLVPVPGPSPWLIATRSAHAVALGLVIGYLAEDQHTTRTHLSAAGRIFAAVDGRAGLRASITGVLGELIATFAARSASLWATDPETRTTHVWQLEATDSNAVASRPAAALEGLLDGGRSVRVCLVTRRGRRLEIEDAKGRRRLGPGAPAAALLPAHATRALVGQVPFGDGWAGGLVLVDPTSHTHATGRAWLSSVLPQAGASLYNVYLLGRLRSRATAMERARIARELHDGVIQSLVGVEMRVDVLRRRHEAAGDRTAGELAEIQAHLHEEMLNVRELMEDIRPVAGDVADVPALLAGIADRFRRDTGIDTRFVCPVDGVPLDAARVRELVRIAQESLVNIRKHSGARTVVVRLGISGDGCLLTVDDDGRGFEFAGRFTLDELDEARRGPVVIKERVRQLGGNLVLDSAPGRGSRLEIWIPRRSDA